MDLLNQADLLQLSLADNPGSHVSMFMPTHRFGSGVEADQIRWKNALTALESMLAARGMRKPDIEELLAPAWMLHRDTLAWQHMSDGLAMFLRPGWHEVFRVPISLPELTTVGDRFIVGPFVPLLTEDQHFLLLAVSQRQVRLLEGTRYRVEEIRLPGIPSSLRDVVPPPEPRSEAVAWSTSPRGSGPAIFFGHGAADEHFKKDEVKRFLRQVAGVLDDYLATQNLPLLLVGLEHIISLYRSATDYPHVMDEDVRRNPDPLTADELHAAAWPVVEQRLRADKDRVVERFNELHGTGQASTDPAALADAAANGRIETLLLAASPPCWERFSTESPRVLELGADDASAHCELLDRITVDTLARGGHVYSFLESQVPGGGDVAAIFRY